MYSTSEGKGGGDGFWWWVRFSRVSAGLALLDFDCRGRGISFGSGGRGWKGEGSLLLLSRWNFEKSPSCEHTRESSQYVQVQAGLRRRTGPGPTTPPGLALGPGHRSKWAWFAARSGAYLLLVLLQKALHYSLDLYADKLVSAVLLGAQPGSCEGRICRNERPPRSTVEPTWRWVLASQTRLWILLTCWWFDSSAGRTSLTVRSTSTPPTIRKHLRSGLAANASRSVSITSLHPRSEVSVDLFLL